MHSSLTIPVYTLAFVISGHSLVLSDLSSLDESWPSFTSNEIGTSNPAADYVVDSSVPLDASTEPNAFAVPNGVIKPDPFDQALNGLADSSWPVLDDELGLNFIGNSGNARCSGANQANRKTRARENIFCPKPGTDTEIETEPETNTGTQGHGGRVYEEGDHPMDSPNHPVNKPVPKTETQPNADAPTNPPKDIHDECSRYMKGIFNYAVCSSKDPADIVLAPVLGMVFYNLKHCSLGTWLRASGN